MKNHYAKFCQPQYIILYVIIIVISVIFIRSTYMNSKAERIFDKLNNSEIIEIKFREYQYEVSDITIMINNKADIDEVLSQLKLFKWQATRRKKIRMLGVHYPYYDMRIKGDDFDISISILSRSNMIIHVYNFEDEGYSYIQLKGYWDLEDLQSIFDI